MGRIISYIMEKMFETTNQIKYYDCHQPVPWCSEKETTRSPETASKQKENQQVGSVQILNSIAHQIGFQ